MEKTVSTSDIKQQFPNMPNDTVQRIMNFMMSERGIFIGNIAVSVSLSVSKWLDSQQISVKEQHQKLNEWRTL